MFSHRKLHKCFTILEPQEMSIDVTEQRKIYQSTDFEALQLWKVQSGRNGGKKRLQNVFLLFMCVYKEGQRCRRKALLNKLEGLALHDPSKHFRNSEP